MCLLNVFFFDLGKLLKSLLNIYFVYLGHAWGWGGMLNSNLSDIQRNKLVSHKMKFKEMATLAPSQINDEP